MREFPEYKDELPNDVIAYIEKGSTPIEAMLRFKLDASEQKIKEPIPLIVMALCPSFRIPIRKSV